jgi:hypothetical protein
MKQLKLFESKVCLDDAYEEDEDGKWITNPDKVYKVFIDAEDNGWNGFANPYFTKEERDKMLKPLIESFGEDDDLIIDMQGIKPQTVEGNLHDDFGTIGVKMELYYFGGGYVWQINDNDFSTKRAKTKGGES